MQPGTERSQREVAFSLQVSVRLARGCGVGKGTGRAPCKVLCATTGTFRLGGVS